MKRKQTQWENGTKKNTARPGRIHHIENEWGKRTIKSNGQTDRLYNTLRQTGRQRQSETYIEKQCGRPIGKTQQESTSTAKPPAKSMDESGKQKTALKRLLKTNHSVCVWQTGRQSVGKAVFL